MATPALLVILAVLALLMQICIRKLARRLRERHPETFNGIGMEDLSGERLPRSEDPGPTFRLIGFCWRRDYLRLGDGEVSRLGALLRAAMLAWPCLFAAFVIVASMPTATKRSAGTAASPSSSASSFEDRRQAAYDLHRKLKWPQAIAAYDVLLGERRDDTDLLFYRGMAQWKSAHFDEALRDFQRVAELDPTHLEAHRSADHLLGRQKRWDDMLALWDRYIAHQPRDAEAYFVRGRAFFEKGSIAAARADAGKACQLGKTQACAMAERLKDK